MVGLWGIDPYIALAGLFVGVFFLVLLLVFATLYSMDGLAVRVAAVLLLWVVTIAFSVVVSLTTTSVFFDWPVSMRSHLVPTPNEYADEYAGVLPAVGDPTYVDQSLALPSRIKPDV